MGASSLFGAPGIGPDMLRISEDVVPKQHPVIRFGRNSDLPNSGFGDIWDRTTQPDWLAPTDARIHNIFSSSLDDTDGGSGAHRVLVFGLKTWASVETSEIVILDGITVVPTVESYVIIHRMVVILYGEDGPNIGNIIAAAQVDSTVTAQITPGHGQTRMAILGVPSVQKFYITIYRASFLKNGGSTGRVDVMLMSNEIPDIQPVPFIERHTKSINSEATSNSPTQFAPFLEVVGPAIVKVRCGTDGNNFDISASFDGILVDNS